MTAHELETRFLSLRFWLQRCVLPSMLSLCALIVFVKLFIESPRYQDQTALILGFSIVYFILFRAGHIFMIRAMHFDLKRVYGKAYDAKLRALPKDMHRRNLGFTLARIKRELIDSRP